ncbi:MAG: ATP-dependent helicase [Candidatus Pacebacteria bacterium]|jgi:DNA helicase II / ATP-dependent DNA helicase PcrA|nr:ATP-dependent helicase [Candidatus Paceibacterota bacterium]MBT4652813.1 ATP-dependent helicase [Candidatus Paceibacterota bacterium]MBT6756603.1 ATP-dependent helicase [Candidatus Paceibacterota bacterium]MBT6921339.1 ATP-dependent helicase [Candidatus Paceibacterota bacterium]
MSQDQNFTHVYNYLNTAQKKAVDTTDGPVMVLAGPGTGKTQVLTARIAQILKKTDTNPSNILALTFTESAAKNMRERLVKMIGRTGYYVQIATFHAFCKEIIDTHPEAFPIERDSTPLSDLERYELFEDIFQNLALEYIKPMNTPFFYIKDAIKGISDLKREGIEFHAYEKMLEQWETRLTDTEPPPPEKGKRARKKPGELSRTEWEKDEKQFHKNKELWEVYKTYQKRLRETKRYDFDDMIALVVEAFQKDDLLLREYQENLHYFLVDEYQDTNAAQNTVVNLLASYWKEKANVFVVGDPNQAIYRFQGASVENMLGFVQNYPNAEIITLETGYRCPQNIYDVATQLITHNNLEFSLTEKTEQKSNSENSKKTQSISLNAKLTSPKGKGEKVELTSASSQVLEAVQIAEQIKKLLAQGTPAHEISILYRHNADKITLAEVFDSWDIDYEVEGGGDALREENIRQLIVLFRVVTALRTGEETELLYETLQYDWLKKTFGWNNSIVLKVARAAGRAKMPILDLVEKGVEKINEYNPGHEITKENLEPLEKYIEQLKAWDTADANKTFPAWFEDVLNESGFLPWLLEQDGKIFLVTVLNSVFGEIKKLVNHNHQFKLKDFLRSLDLIEEHGLKITIEDLNVRRDAVHLSTVHKAKGREWEFVFLFQCVDKKWGNNRKRDLIKLPAEILHNTDLSSKERNEDERRLFYVAITRAKKQAIVSHPETVISEGHTRDMVPSMFLAEIQEDDDQATLWKEVSHPEIEKDSADHLVKLLQPIATTVPEVTDAAERIYLRWLLDNFRWSVTALNTYLRDPEEFLHNTLLRVPRAKSPILSFGTAMHSAMEFIYKTFQQTGNYPALADLQQQFSLSLKQEVMTPVEHEKRLKHGKEVLVHYHEQLTGKNPDPLYIEKMFGNSKHKVMLDDIPLNGRIDRVDWVDKENKQVKVIDYKTGKTRSANDIEGKTKSAKLSERERELPESIRGPYKRQLLFYKLLAKLDRGFPYEVMSGEFEFVEPNNAGKIVTRNFELLDEDVRVLGELIKEVVEELRGRW